MKFRTFQKDTWRSIRHSLSRFIAIFAIVALGAGFYAGLGATAPDMRVTADGYYDEGNMMDIHLLSTLGFTDGDIDAIRARDGVSGVMAGYSADFISAIDGKEQVVRIHSLPADRSADNPDYINRPVLVSGRMPERADECLLGVSKLDENAVGVGSEILLEDKDGKLGDTLSYSRYTVVGTVQSAYYLSFSLGSSSIGSGTINHFIYVPEDAFCVEAYTDVFATVEGAAARNAFEDSYDDLIDPVIDDIESISSARAQLRYEEVRTESDEKLADAQTELDDARAEADSELADAYAELMDGQRKIDDGEREIRENRQKLRDAQQEIEQNNTKLRAAQNDYDAGYAQYAAGLAQYNDGLAQYNAGDAGHTQLSALCAGYWAAYAGYQGAGYDDAAIAAMPLNPADPGGMTMGAAAATLAGGLGGAGTQAAQQAALAAMRQSLDAAKATLDANGPVLSATGAQLADAKATLDNGWYSLNTARAQLETGRQELEDAAAELADAKAELADGWTEYNDAKAEADEKLADAQAELDDARETVEKLKVPDWYVLSRHTNVGFASYESDADRMASLSTVFPVLFFLVAALVALTTMTRMIEEERGIIGTYKALGYSGWRIISKYLLYALLASVFGSALGIALGLVALPTVCYNSYRILYTGPDLVIGLNLKYVIEGAAAATACTLVSTYAACRSSLREPTASLLLPKAPKAGKRILLERITPIWNRMKFTSKVTWRNIFRYKKRLIMTLVGIAGCTGLLLTGFGIKDSVSSILSNQYGKVYQYDTVVSFEGEEPSAALRALLEDESLFSGSLTTAVKAAEITAGDASVQGYTCVPQGSLEGFVALQTRAGGAVSFGEDSVVITEKAAKVLGVGVGDSVTIKNADEEPVSFTITGVTEHYIYHYLYIAPALYESRMGEAPAYNQVDAICLAQDDEARDALADRLLAAQGVETATFTDAMSANFDDMITSLNYVIFVIILCAGALAFVVVYNLTNINITERRRELATIKVLGFHRREVQNYIFRETNLLTLFGSIIGLGAGKLMHAFVITTVEVDIVMFGREIAPVSFLISFLLTNLFSQLVNLFMKNRLAKIDMVESLKSVD